MNVSKRSDGCAGLRGHDNRRSAAKASSPVAEPQPSCRSAETGPVGGPSHLGDGVADPAGRIAYAVVGRLDEVFGPIGTQLYAIDPDGATGSCCSTVMSFVRSGRPMARALRSRSASTTARGRWPRSR